jgi:5-methylcytosine-specific restriction endonuclease McrA
VYPLLNNPVLVLNRHWQPVNICSARRAVSLLCMGHAQVVWTDGNNNFSTHDIESWASFNRDAAEMEIIRSISVSFGIPEIIVLSLFDRLPKKEIKFTRQNVFERDEYTCQYCGDRFESKELNLDHVIPREKGGKNSWDNIVTSCIRCNTKKANKLPHQANMHPFREPKAPRWRPFMCLAEKTARRKAYASWRYFLDLKTACVEITD